MVVGGDERLRSGLKITRGNYRENRESTAETSRVHSSINCRILRNLIFYIYDLSIRHINANGHKAIFFRFAIDDWLELHL